MIKGHVLCVICLYEYVSRRCNIVEFNCCVQLFTNYFQNKILQGQLVLAQLATSNELTQAVKFKSTAVLLDLLIQSAGQGFRKCEYSIAESGFVRTSVCEYHAIYLYS